MAQYELQFDALWFVSKLMPVGFLAIDLSVLMSFNLIILKGQVYGLRSFTSSPPASSTVAQFACRSLLLRSGNNLTDEDFDVLLKMAGLAPHQDALVVYT